MIHAFGANVQTIVRGGEVKLVYPSLIGRLGHHVCPAVGMVAVGITLQGVVEEAGLVVGITLPGVAGEDVGSAVILKVNYSFD